VLRPHVQHHLFCVKQGFVRFCDFLALHIFSGVRF
jgi:hypothetical protein